jgi:hypothetical protein
MSGDRISVVQSWRSQNCQGARSAPVIERESLYDFNESAALILRRNDWV